GGGTPREPVGRPDPPADGHFGLAVAVLGPILFVGAPGERGGAGKVYWFDIPEGLSGQLEQPLTGAGGFGSSLAAASSRLVVGSPFEGDGAGAAYLFSVLLPEPSPCLSLEGLD